jgi:hypothetical protein
MQKTYRIFPSDTAWFIEDDGLRRGPYCRPELAVQLALSQASLGRSLGRATQLLVQDEMGAVIFQWSSQNAAVSGAGACVG